MRLSLEDPSTRCQYCQAPVQLVSGEILYPDQPASTRRSSGTAPQGMGRLPRRNHPAAAHLGRCPAAERPDLRVGRQRDESPAGRRAREVGREAAAIFESRSSAISEMTSGRSEPRASAARNASSRLSSSAQISGRQSAINDAKSWSISRNPVSS